MTISVDGVEYIVKTAYPSHEVTARILSGNNAGISIGFADIPDVGATAYDHRMKIEPDERYPGDFDALYNVLTAPVDSHRVILPFGQGTQEFDAAVSVAKITDYGIQGGYRRWQGLEVTYRPITPQRMRTE